MRRWFGLLLIFGMFFNLSLVEGKVPPKPTSNIYVQDFAGVMDSESKAKILQMGQELEAKTTAQVVVVTVPSLEGQDLQSYSLEILRTWGVGQKDKNNGVVILLAIQEKKSRIEVGYGLEGDLPDGKTGRIQDEYMLPLFKEAKYGQGMVQGYGAIAAVIGGTGGSDAPPLTGGVINPNNGFPAWMVLGVIVLVPAGIFFWMRKFLQSFKTKAPTGRYPRNTQRNPDIFGTSRREQSQNWMEIILYIIMMILRGGGRGGRGGGGGGFGGGSGGGGGSSRGF